MSLRYSIIIPAHNEEQRIEKTLQAYAPEFADSEIIVVLNGCTDRTLEIVDRLARTYTNISYVDVGEAVGKGGAVRIGFLLAGAPVVGYVDADGATDAHEMRRLCGLLQGDDAIIASRWLPGSDVHVEQPLKRRIASRTFNSLVRLIFGLHFSDTQCGAKVFRADALASILPVVETANFAFDVDLLYELRRAGKKLREVPTIWRDVDGSQVKLVVSSIRMLAALIRLRLRYSVFRTIIPLFDRLFPTAPLRARSGLKILIMNWRDPKNPKAGGAENYLFEIARRMVAEGHSVEWLTAGYPNAPQSEDLNGITVTRVGNALTVYLMAAVTYLRKFRDRFDVIVDAENGIPFFSPMYSLKTKVCLVFHVHQRVFKKHLPFPLSSIFAWIEARFMPWLYGKSTFVTISEDTRNEMEELGMSHHPIPVVHPGHDASLVPGVKSPGPSILYLGRLKHYKRVDVLLRALAHLRKTIPHVRLDIAGEGDSKQHLIDLAIELGVRDAVTFHGFVDDNEKRSLMQQSWAFAMPSEMEGWGITVIEANACGTAAVAFRVPGLSESVQDGKSGLLADTEAEYVEALRRLLTDGEFRAALERGAIEHAKQFSWNSAAQKFLRALARADSRNAPGMLRLDNEEWKLYMHPTVPDTGSPIQMRQPSNV